MSLFIDASLAVASAGWDKDFSSLPPTVQKAAQIALESFGGENDFLEIILLDLEEASQKPLVRSLERISKRAIKFAQFYKCGSTLTRHMNSWEFDEEAIKKLILEVPNKFLVEYLKRKDRKGKTALHNAVIWDLHETQLHEGYVIDRTEILLHEMDRLEEEARAEILLLKDNQNKTAIDYVLASNRVSIKKRNDILVQLLYVSLPDRARARVFQEDQEIDWLLSDENLTDLIENNPVPTLV